jgi:signal transduction histidine kinase
MVRERNLFRSMLSHDIRNPLNIIYNYADMVEEEIRGAPAARDLLQRIKDNALTTLDLVSNFVELGRIESGKLTLERRSMCLSDLVRHVVNRHLPMAHNEGLSIQLENADEIPHIDADRAYMERVITNLVSNAIKFTPRGGTVSVHVGLVEGGVGVVVRDTGRGIPQEELTQIFEKYRRGMDAEGTEGTGLGLFIVRSVIEAHGGTVSVDSSVGEGTGFTIFLPDTGPAAWSEGEARSA